MQKQISVKLLPSEADDETLVKTRLAAHLAIDPGSISGFTIVKKSLDARSRSQWVLITVIVYINEPYINRSFYRPELKDVRHASKTAIIVGAGPAGLFAAIRLIERGIKPILLERGKDVRTRRRDLAALNKSGILNPESNYCFGEGGAGTYSDGKLYTRSSKRGDIQRILSLFVHFGAEEKILYEAHPHIGTNKLPLIISAMRDAIIDAGGEVHFDQKLTELKISGHSIKGVGTQKGEIFESGSVILATGHSARDIFELLHAQKILIEQKSFALGVRIEHPQALIDSIQYHCTLRSPYLPPASYSLVHPLEDRGVFSFCMCPGGIIAPASTELYGLVVNGWSPSKRNNPFANSGIVVSVNEPDLSAHTKTHGPLAGMIFQREVEEAAYSSGGGNFVAPAQRMVDFFDRKISATIPGNSYLPGLRSSPLNEVLPGFIYNALRNAFAAYGKKMKGYFTNEAVVVATESRTSSPVRIPRDKLSLQHPQISGLYPCGEGAGYAGGIVSAAMDGENVANMIS